MELGAVAMGSVTVIGVLPRPAALGARRVHLAHALYRGAEIFSA
jgi:hypothetical protein